MSHCSFGSRWSWMGRTSSLMERSGFCFATAPMGALWVKPTRPCTWSSQQTKTLAWCTSFQTLSSTLRRAATAEAWGFDETLDLCSLDLIGTPCSRTSLR